MLLSNENMKSTVNKKMYKLSDRIYIKMPTLTASYFPYLVLEPVQERKSTDSFYSLMFHSFIS